MDQPRQKLSSEDNPDAASSAPLFTEKEVKMAQPVVPVDIDPVVAETLGTVPPTHIQGNVKRRFWHLALILISAFIGVILGATVLYFYEKYDGAAATVESPGHVSTQIGALPPPQAAKSSDTTRADVKPSQTPSSANSGDTTHKIELPEKSTTENSPSRETPRVESKSDDTLAKSSATAPSKSSQTNKAANAPKQRRKEALADINLTQVPRGSVLSSRPSINDDVRDDNTPRARRVSNIIYPERQQARREGVRRSDREPPRVDPVRRIFEGEPE